MGKLLIGLIILLLIGMGSFFLLLNSSSNVESNVVADTSGAGEIKTFVLTGKNFKFMMNGEDNPNIRVKEGEKIRIEFASIEGFHDWKVDEFNAATKKVNAEGSTSVEFIANKKGTFEYYCSVGQHRANGMKGNLIVE